MAMSTITVGGLNPLLNILGTTQQFIFSQQHSVFRLNNTYIPTSLINSETDFDIINNRLSGYRLFHTTTNTDTYGTLTLQSFVNAQSSSSGTNILQFNNSGIGAFADLNMNSHNVTGGVWNGAIINVSEGGTGIGNTTAYSVLCGGTTSTGPLQSLSSLGTTGQVLTSQGSGALPIWSTPLAGTVTSIIAGTGLSGGTITTSGTIAIANTAVTAGSYTYANITVNAQGQLTAASSNTPVTSITAGTGLSGGTITSTGTIAIANTGVTAGSYTYGNFTVNAQGQITAAAINFPVTSITAGVGLNGGTITSTGTISIADTAVTPGSYTYGSFTVNSRGQLTAASSGTSPVTSITAGTGLSGGTITSTGTISLSSTTVTPGTYTFATITVNAQGQLTAASTGTNLSLASSSVPTAPGNANDGIYSVNLGKAKFTSGTTISSGTLVTASLSTGAATCGNNTLNGTTGVTISTTAIQTSSVVVITRNNGTSGAPSGTSVGTLSVASIVAGTSFKVYSTNSADTFGFSWLLINP